MIEFDSNPNSVNNILFSESPDKQEPKTDDDKVQNFIDELKSKGFSEDFATKLVQVSIEQGVNIDQLQSAFDTTYKELPKDENGKLVHIDERKIQEEINVNSGQIFDRTNPKPFFDRHQDVLNDISGYWQEWGKYKGNDNISMGDLQEIAAGTNTPENERKAAQFLIDYSSEGSYTGAQSFFEFLDTDQASRGHDDVLGKNSFPNFMTQMANLNNMQKM